MHNLKTFVIMLFGIFSILLSIYASIWYINTQHYVQDSKTTAVTGILYTKTLNLQEYRNVASGNDIWGRYDSYSRSDRHTEVLTIYCKKFCK